MSGVATPVMPRLCLVSIPINEYYSSTSENKKWCYLGSTVGGATKMDPNIIDLYHPVKYEVNQSRTD